MIIRQYNNNQCQEIICPHLQIILLTTEDIQDQTTSTGVKHLEHPLLGINSGIRMHIADTQQYKKKEDISDS